VAAVAPWVQRYLTRRRIVVGQTTLTAQPPAWPPARVNARSKYRNP